MAVTESGIQLERVGHHPNGDGHRFEYNQTTTTTMAVVAALTDVLGVGPTQLAPLETRIDTEALDAFFAAGPTASETRTLTFSAEGYTVTVRSGGVVTLSPADETGADERAATQR